MRPILKQQLESLKTPSNATPPIVNVNPFSGRKPSVGPQNKENNMALLEKLTGGGNGGQSIDAAKVAEIVRNEVQRVMSNTKKIGVAQERNYESEIEAVKSELLRRVKEVELKCELHISDEIQKLMQASPRYSRHGGVDGGRFSTQSLISDVDQLTIELQTTIGSLKSKLDAFSAKVDSIDLSYDKRISNLEATVAPLIVSIENLQIS